LYASPFEFHAPTSIEEALSLLGRYGDEAKVLAGGQSLIPMMTLRLVSPSVVVDVNALDDGGLRLQDESLSISAFTRQKAVERSDVVRRGCPILADAIRYIGNIRVRSRGTIGGNLAHGDPSSELSCAALAAGARVTVVGPKGSRSVPLKDLFVAYLTTSLDPSELITEVMVPTMGADTGWAFFEMARRAGEFAIVNVACLMSVDPSGQQFTRVSLALGGVSDTPLDVSREAEDVLVNERTSERAFNEVARRAQAVADPRDDVHAPAEYKRKVVGVYVRRALELAHQRARGGEG
jgi:CO/xanthine dehydrogenase FAD-binding subunit